VKIFIKTFGCKVNQYESEKIKYNLKINKHEIVNSFKKSDVTIINSCIVTQKSEKKSKDLVKQIKNYNKNIEIILIGCLVEKESIKEADYNINNKNKIKNTLKILDVNNIQPLEKIKKQTRAFIKIQDGCDQFCSYCIIPYVRKNITNKPIKKIIHEAEKLSVNGFKEIVLTGIHLGKHPGLVDIIEKISKINNIKRIRLSSIQINEISNELIQQLSVNNKMMEHLHISLQSGSNKILKLMNRPYSKEYFIDKVKTIRKKIPSFGLSTDLIVGFPGEEKKDFYQSLNLLRKLKFHRVHVFPYSRREGTKAFKMKDVVPEKIKNKRAKKIRKISSQIFSKFVNDLKKRTYKVLVEASKNGNSYGYTENYLRCKILNDIIKPNEIVNTKIIDKINNKHLIIGRKKLGGIYG